MSLATQARAEIKAHEDICALRYGDINKTLATIMRLLVWGGLFAFTTIMGLLTWSLNQQYQSNLQARQEAAAKIETLQRQIDHEQQPPNVTVVK